MKQGNYFVHHHRVQELRTLKNLVDLKDSLFEQSEEAPL